MLSLDDPRWQPMNGAYRSPYNPAPALRQLAEGADAAPVWEEFWSNLHHQGDVDVASYAVVPHLVKIQLQRGDLDWNFFALVSTVEIERHRKRNPPLPDWLEADYTDSWRELLTLALGALAHSKDRLLTRAALATVAVAKGELRRGAMLLELDDAEIDALLADRPAWSATGG